MARLLAVVDEHPPYANQTCPTHPLRPPPTGVPSALTHPCGPTSDNAPDIPNWSVGLAVHELALVPSSRQVQQQAVRVWAQLGRVLDPCRHS